MSECTNLTLRIFVINFWDEVQDDKSLEVSVLEEPIWSFAETQDT